MKIETLPIARLNPAPYNRRAEFTPIPGFPSYLCSVNGSIYSTHKKGKLLKPSPDKDGYLAVVLTEGRRRHYVKVHQAVALTFVGARPHGMCVNHKDGDRQNNKPENLEWLTPADNERHARRVLGKRCVGEKASRSKISTATALAIFESTGKGVSQRVIGDTFSISQAQISRIARKVNWGHIHGS